MLYVERGIKGGEGSHRVSTEWEKTERWTKKAMVRRDKPGHKDTGRRRLEETIRDREGWKALTVAKKIL